MSLSSGIVGARHSAQRITWKKEDGTAYNLTGATVTARIRDQRTGEARNADGTFTVDPDQTTNTGVFTWAYGAIDVGTAGNFEVQFVASYGDSKNDKTFKTAWAVDEAL